MRRAVNRSSIFMIFSFIFIFSGCDGGIDGLVTPERTSEIQRQFADANRGLQEANDRAVSKLSKYGLSDSGEDKNPPFMSWDWISETLHEKFQELRSQKQASPDILGKTEDIR